MKVFFKMELPKIGKQCAQSECNQLDFLPLQCKCGKTFCSEHFYLHVQACETSKIVTDDELTKIGQLFICSSEGCSEKSIIPLICEKCGKHFCVKHRHLTECEPTHADTLAKEREKYAKPVRMFNEAKAVVDQEVEKKIDDAKKKTKSREMASKLQLMKIKNKATGLKSIPVANRIYFNVFHSEKATPIFVSSQWSVGRAIDAIAQEMNLQNNNNKSTEKKLRLFKKCDNQIISQNVSSVLKSLLESKFILDGDSLVIEYVDDDCVKL